MENENSRSAGKQAFYHLEICCRYVGEKYGSPIISGWTNRDYIKLSGVLSRQMNVQISPNTLKRIFGKLKTPERYYPQKATRDTLARYAGFEHWDDFVQKHPRPAPDVKPPDKNADIASIPEPVNKEVFSIKRWWPALVPLVILFALMAWWLNKDDNAGFVDVTGVQLVCINPEGTNPHSAIFQLKISPEFKGEKENFLLDFGDKKRVGKISPSKLLTHYYEIPGRYYPVLFYNDIALDTISVYLQTNGWTATANMQADSTRVYPLPDQNLAPAQSMRVSTGELFRAGVDTNRTFFVHFVNARPMDLAGDNFELTSDLRTSRERAGVRCSQVNVSIYGETSRHHFSLMKSGCASFNVLQFSEKLIKGESEDLRNLSRDLSSGGTLKMQVRHQQVKLWIDGQQVYRASYQKALGKIYGIEILFSGIGEVFTLALRDLNTGMAFNERLEPDKTLP